MACPVWSAVGNAMGYATGCLMMTHGVAHESFRGMIHEPAGKPWGYPWSTPWVVPVVPWGASLGCPIVSHNRVPHGVPM